MNEIRSKLFTVQLEHERLQPVEHRFHYPVRIYAFDLAELSMLDRRLPLFSHNRFNLVSLHDRDYLDAGPGSIRDKLLPHLRKQGVSGAIDRVVLITSARYLNRVFNPVSFYYVYRDAGDLAAIVAEVNNTFGERHLYVLTEPDPNPGRAFRRYQADKAFHVSPFHDMSGRYEFYFSDLERELAIEIQLWKSDQMAFRARIQGAPQALTAWNLARQTLRRPLLPHLTMPRILWQAAKLYGSKRLRVFSKPVAQSPWTLRKNPPTLRDKIFEPRVLEVLSKVAIGRLQVTLPDGTVRRFGEAGGEPTADLLIRDPSFFSRVALGGDVGFGESFMEDGWDSSDPTALLRLLIDNREALADGSSPAARLLARINRLRHLARPNSVPGSRRNIRRHYDLSNDFFAAFLDSTMTYSCALFQAGENDLEQAQRRKLRAIADKARLRATDHVLEIGCGWGGFAILAARETGCRVTGITVSQAQCELARTRVGAAGLEDRVEIVLRDYRQMRGRFDKIISIEMLEAVGDAHYPDFFRCCERLLTPRGLVVLQTITIPDHRYDAYRKDCDWIQKYIFPGGLLPSVTALSRAMAETSRFHLESLENIGVHYALTLRQWRLRLLDQWDQIGASGFDREFRRMWLYYLCYCEAAFATRTLNNVQMVLSRPNNFALDDE